MESETMRQNASGMGRLDEMPEIKMDMTYVPIAVYTFLFFGLLGATISPLMSWYFFPKYRAITTYEKFDWNSRLISLLHAVLVSVLGTYNLLFDAPTWADPIWGNSYLPRATLAITSGYILSDLGLMLVGFPWKESVFYIAHHLAVFTAFAANVLYGPLTFFGNARVIAEASTPFVNLRWMLYLLGYKDSKLYLYNGFVMLGMFFLVRVAMIPFYYYIILTSLIFGGFRRLPVWMTLVCLVSSMALDVINVYWFRKMFRGAYRMLQKRADQKPDPADQTRLKEQ